MLKGNYKKLLCFILVLALTACAFAMQSTAADEPLIHSVTELTAIDANDNDTKTMEYHYDFGTIPTISAYQGSNGTYALCVQQNDGSLKIVEVTAKGTVSSQLTVAKELDSYVAFTKGNDGSYYILFNKKLTSEQKSETALRLVNYSQAGERLREFNIPGNVSGSFLGVAEISAGNNALCANDNLITGYVGRYMFPDESQTQHQASYAFAVDLKANKLIEVNHSAKSPYVSHSFHQFILKDGEDFVYVDRGDCLPFRSFRVSKMCGTSWTKNPDTYTGISGLVETEYKRGNSFRIKGADGDNHTYSQLGGIVKTDSGYMLAGTYQNTTTDTAPSSANVFVQLFEIDSLSAQKEIYLTNYTDSAQSLNKLTATANNPKILSINGNKVAVAYMLSNAAKNSEEMHIVFADGSGKLLENKTVALASGGSNLPRYGNVYYSNQNDSIVWFGIVNGKLIMNSVSLTDKAESTTGEITTVDAETTTAKPETTTAKPETTTAEPEATTAKPETTTAKPEATTEAPTEAPTEPKPPEPNFFQRVLNFLIKIYRWVISLFS